MDDQSRSVWTQINPKIRSKIVKSITTNNPSPSSNTNLFTKNRNGNSSINLHDISLHDLLVNFHVSNQPESTPTDDTIATTEEETTTNTNNETTSQDNDQLLIQAVKGSVSNISKGNHSPAYIRSVLFKKKTRSVNVQEII